MASVAFIDESGRGSTYYVVAVVVAEHDADQLRKLARSLRVRGQERWHFTKEKPSRRAQILTVLLSTGLCTAEVALGKGPERMVRARCMAALGPSLTRTGSRRIVIESRAGRDDQDRRVLQPLLAGAGVMYEHQPPRADPCLWWADAVAWSYGYGGTWRERLQPLISTVHDVGAA